MVALSGACPAHHFICSFLQPAEHLYWFYSTQVLRSNQAACCSLHSSWHILNYTTKLSFRVAVVWYELLPAPYFSWLYRRGACGFTALDMAESVQFQELVIFVLWKGKWKNVNVNTFHWKCKLLIITVNIFLSNAVRHSLYFFLMT